MTKKEQCKELMRKFFGEASASMVDRMDEEECVATCRKKVAALLDEEKAKEFDSI